MRNVYEYAYKILKKQYNAVNKLNIKVLEDKDIEDLHQMRVAVRKLRAAISCFKDYLDSANYEKIWKDVKLLAKNLGRVRDLDVAIDYMTDYLNNDIDNNGVDYVLKRYKRLRKERYKKLSKFIDGKKYKKLMKNLGRLVDNLNSDELVEKYESAEPEFCSFICDLVDKVYSFKDTDDLKNKDKSLHEMRIAIKHLRYNLEFAESNDSDAKNIIKFLKTSQEQLGIINDCNVMNNKLKKIISKYKLKDGFEEGIIKLIEHNDNVRRDILPEIKLIWEHIPVEDIKNLTKKPM